MLARVFAIYIKSFCLIEFHCQNVISLLSFSIVVTEMLTYLSTIICSDSVSFMTMNKINYFYFGDSFSL